MVTVAAEAGPGAAGCAARGLEPRELAPRPLGTDGRAEPLVHGQGPLEVGRASSGRPR